MKIVHLYDGHEKIYQGRGSLPRIVWNIARRTAAHGHDVTVMERQWAGLSATDSHDGVNFQRLALRTGSNEPWADVPYEMVNSVSGMTRLMVDRLNFGLAARRMLDSIEFDVLHVYLPFAANVLVTIAPRFRHRMVYTAQLGELRLNALTDQDEDLKAPEILEVFSPDIYLAKRVGHTTVLNQSIKRIFEQNGVPSYKLTHIPNGVDIAKFSQVESDARERVAAKYNLEDRTIVLFVGTVMPRKGVLPLVKAADIVINDRDFSDIRVVIAGENDLDEEYTDEIREYIEKTDMNDNFVFTGYLTDSDLLPLYELSDIFVLPSFEEGFGMVVSEAMSTGTPAIGSAISGIDQQIEDEKTGYLVEPGNPDALAEKISELLENTEKRERMAERSERKAEQFSWDTIVEQYIDVYNSL